MIDKFLLVENGIQKPRSWCQVCPLQLNWHCMQTFSVDRRRKQVLPKLKIHRQHFAKVPYRYAFNHRQHTLCMIVLKKCMEYKGELFPQHNIAPKKVTVNGGPKEVKELLQLCCRCLSSRSKEVQELDKEYLFQTWFPTMSSRSKTLPP